MKLEWQEDDLDCTSDMHLRCRMQKHVLEVSFVFCAPCGSHAVHVMSSAAPVSLQMSALKLWLLHPQNPRFCFATMSCLALARCPGCGCNRNLLNLGLYGIAKSFGMFARRSWWACSHTSCYAQGEGVASIDPGCCSRFQL
eukprot:4581552-Amphidinium_carterae.1